MCTQASFSFDQFDLDLTKDLRLRTTTNEKTKYVKKNVFSRYARLQEYRFGPKANEKSSWKAWHGHKRRPNATRKERERDKYNLSIRFLSYTMGMKDIFLQNRT